MPVATLVSGVLFRDCGRGVRRPFQSEQRVMRYEDRSHPVRGRRREPHLMALAHIGGFAERLPGWLAASQQKYPTPRKYGNAYSMHCRRRYRDDRGGATDQI
jgi:hypothetical protein